MAGTFRALNLNPLSTGISPLRCWPTCCPIHSVPMSNRPSIHVSGSGSSSLTWKLHFVRRLSVRASQLSNWSSNTGDQPSGAPGLEKVSWVKSFSTSASNNFLPIALVGGVALGLVNPTLGCVADRYYLSKFSTVGIFLLSGLTLCSEEIGAAAEAWPVGIFGLSSILLFSPLLSRLIMHLQLQPQEFVTGLAIFCCMPTTLSSGVALTRLAGGNSALALAMTIVSNLLGILIVPLSISKFIADGVGVSFATKKLFTSLILMLLVPLIFGKVVRESFRGLATFADHNRKLFSMMSASLLSLVPWIQVSRSRSLLLMVKPGVFLVAVGMGVILHLILLAFNALAIQSLSLLSGGNKSPFSNEKNARALLLVASQKTLPVMVAVVEQLGGAFGESGLLVVPCVAAHLTQIILDSVLISLWLPKDHSFRNANAAGEVE